MTTESSLQPLVTFHADVGNQTGESRDTTHLCNLCSPQGSAQRISCGVRHLTVVITYGGLISSSLIPALQAYVRNGLKVVGIVSDAKINAKAFYWLETKLFRLLWVEGVATKGLVRQSNNDSRRTDILVFVITSQMLHSTMQRDVDKIVAKINCRFGTTLMARVIQSSDFISDALH